MRKVTRYYPFFVKDEAKKLSEIVENNGVHTNKKNISIQRDNNVKKPVGYIEMKIFSFYNETRKQTGIGKKR